MVTTRPRLSDRRAAEQQRRQAVIEDVEWLTDCGEHPENVARRVGYANAANLAVMLDRWGRAGLARRLRRVDDRVAV